MLLLWCFWNAVEAYKGGGDTQHACHDGRWGGGAVLLHSYWNSEAEDLGTTQHHTTPCPPQSSTHLVACKGQDGLLRVLRVHVLHECTALPRGDLQVGQGSEGLTHGPQRALVNLCEVPGTGTGTGTQASQSKRRHLRDHNVQRNQAQCMRCVAIACAMVCCAVREWRVWRARAVGECSSRSPGPTPPMNTVVLTPAAGPGAAAGAGAAYPPPYPGAAP